METAAVTPQDSSAPETSGVHPESSAILGPAKQLDGDPAIRNYYRKRLAQIYGFLIPPGMRVLEVGCGQGDLLASVRPSYGVGIDLTPLMIERAQRRHPKVRYIV